MKHTRTPTSLTWVSFIETLFIDHTLLLTGPTCQHAEERDEVIIAGEQAVVVEVDVRAVWLVAAWSPSEDIQEVNQILILREEAIAIEIDGVARGRCAEPVVVRNL